MGAWDTYKQRIEAHGGTKRNAAYLREERMILRKLPDNLSYKNVSVYLPNDQVNLTEDNAVSQSVAIIDSDNLNEKSIYSMPKEDIQLGSLIYWMDNYWLVTERDANTTLYTKAKLLQCNHLLKWIAGDHEVKSQWCVVEDGTKYLTGELEDRNFFTTRGDSRISVQIAKNAYTSVFNRESRFLIDDDDSPHKLSYLLTKPLKRGLVYNGSGTFKFVLQEVTATEYDNHELGIADYYKYFPKDETGNKDDKDDDTSEDGKKVWL